MATPAMIKPSIHFGGGLSGGATSGRMGAVMCTVGTLSDTAGTASAPTAGSADSIEDDGSVASGSGCVEETVDDLDSTVVTVVAVVSVDGDSTSPTSEGVPAVSVSACSDDVISISDLSAGSLVLVSGAGGI